MLGKARRDVPVGPLTTYRVGGAAALFLEAEDEADLLTAAKMLQATGLPALVVGNGSNLLVADAGFPGLAITLAGDAFSAIEIEGQVVRAGGAVSLPVLARRTAQAGLAGLEWCVGVPGSVGGAVRMNAGGHGSDTKATLRRCRVVDLAGGSVDEVDALDLELGYRRSNLLPTSVVAAAEHELEPGDPDRSSAQISEIVRWRRENQPGGQNAGSVFTNPPGDSAGRLIDAAGLKGMRLGSAHVSSKHANFFQADDGGSADDIRALIDEVQRRVEAATGVRLQPELQMVGFGT
jgi:UDP-N-acetylmuramate dehydrogenase